MPTEPLVIVEGVTRRFGQGASAVHALRNVSLHIDAGRLTVLKGRSGSGKTTLMNIIGGLDSPTEGRVLLQGRPWSELSDAQRTRLRRSHIGFVFQSLALLPFLSALENVELGLRLAGVDRRERTERARNWLSYVGLDERMHHLPAELSGGEQQRVAIARALATQPALILADEPTAELDTQTAQRVVGLLKRIPAETNTAVCLTTHDPAVMAHADRIYELIDGRIEQGG